MTSLVSRTRQSPFQRRLSKLAAAHNYKARRLGQSGRTTAPDLARIYLVQDALCVYCSVEMSQEGVSFDHVIPFSHGGQNTTDNLVACCITCQRTKYTKNPQELAEWQRLIRYCIGCGGSFRPRWADYKRGFGFYCSRACSGRAGGSMSPP